MIQSTRRRRRRRSTRLAGPHPVDDGDEEDGQQRGDAAEHGAREADEHEEAASKDSLAL